MRPGIAAALLGCAAIAWRADAQAPAPAPQGAPTPAPPAAATGASDQFGEDIVVEGRRVPLGSVLKTVLHTTGQSQLARFERTVCPGVSGAPAGTADTLLALLRETAAAAGARLDPPGCKPNALLIFVSDPRALVAGMKKKNPDFFENLAPDQTRAILGGDARIRSWHLIEAEGRDGEALADVGSIGGSPTGQGTKIVRNAGASRVYANTRQTMKLSFAVVDSRAIVGKSLRQLADIAALHLLLDLRPEAQATAGTNSILSLFADATPPPAMTDFDRGLLGGLYKPSRNNFEGQVQRARIVRAITKETQD